MLQLEQVSSRTGANGLATLDSHPQVTPSRSPAGRVRDWLSANALFVAAVAAVAALSLVLIPRHLNQDGWSALVIGRFVAAHGIPHHDTLAVMSHGARWIDQQWLAQLVIYGLHQLGGLALFSIVYVALSIAGLAITIAGARALGGGERHTLWVLPAAGLLYFAGAFQIRTQGFAYPLFAATLWLLASAARSRIHRSAYLVFPLLVLWGNLHGSVTIGVALAVTYGATLLAEDLRGARTRASRPHIRLRTVLFLIGPVLCLLVTPYGLDIVAYYRETLLNPAFSQLVTEWRPVTASLVLAIPFFALCAATIWLLGRSGRRTPLFDHLALLVLAAAGILALRSVAWFGLGVIMLVPASIGAVLTARPPRRRRTGVNLWLTGLSLAILVGTLVLTAAQPASWFSRGYDLRAARTVAALVARHPATRVYANDRYGDWLLWEEPALTGHIAYDIRFELLSARQLDAIASVQFDRRLLTPYRLLVLDPTVRPATQAVLRRAGTHVILRGRRVVVATTPAL